MALLDQEAGADAYYGFPAGTLEALGQSESGNGQNLGSIGNIFQVLPSTAAQPGYGLASVNGNDPYSVGAYLSALQNGPAGGSLQGALSAYQGYGANSNYQGGNSAMQNFIAGLDGSQDSAGTATGGSSTGTTPTADGAPIANGATSAFDAIKAFISSPSRLALILLAGLLLFGGILMFTFRTVHVDN